MKHIIRSETALKDRALLLMANDRHFLRLNHQIDKTMNTRFNLKQHKELLITGGGIAAILIMTFVFLSRP